MAGRMGIETSRIWSRNDRGSIRVGSQECKLGGVDEVLNRARFREGAQVTVNALVPEAGLEPASPERAGDFEFARLAGQRGTIGYKSPP